MKRVLFFIIFVSMVMISGCSNKSVDIDYKYMYSENNSVQAVTASDNGYYFVNGLYLYYCDFETMESIVLCNKPNCLHDKELDETKKYNCNGFLIVGNECKLLTIYDGYIYCYIEVDVLKDKNPKPELIRISLDGSKRKTICELEENITAIALHRGKLYYGVSSVELNQDEEIYNYKLKEYDVFKYKAKPQVIYEGQGRFGVINNITPIDNKIRYTKYSIEDTVMKGIEYVYDVESENTYRIAEDIGINDIGPLSISSGYFIFTSIDINNDEVESGKFMYKTNIETGESEVLFEKEFSDIMHYSDENYIYVDNILSFNSNKISYEEFNRELDIYDKKGNMIDKINITGIDEYTYFISGDSNYILAKGEDEKGAYIKYIDKSKIGTGAAKLETLFELERKYLDTSVRVIIE